MENICEFWYKDYHCSITKDEFGFWGVAAKENDYIEHMFPEQTLEKEIEELKFSIDQREQ